LARRLKKPASNLSTPLGWGVPFSTLRVQYFQYFHIVPNSFFLYTATKGDDMQPSDETRVGSKLKRLGLTVSVAESATGGLIGSRLTDVAGSSDYYLGGVVAYSNDAKVKLLGVKRETLAAHGAVSEQTAQGMADGVRHSFGSDIGLAVTGIAGPGGATREKPVGLMWLAIAAKNYSEARSIRLSGDRLQNKAGAAEEVLKLLEEYLDTLIPN
jgi:PncC family amidohydrolase